MCFLPSETSYVTLPLLQCRKLVMLLLCVMDISKTIPVTLFYHCFSAENWYVTRAHKDVVEDSSASKNKHKIRDFTKTFIV